MNLEEKYPLLEQFKHYGISYLIPAHFNSDDADDEGYCHTYGDMFDNKIDPSDDRYYDDYDFEAETEDDNDEFIPTEFDYQKPIIGNLDDLCRLFNIDYLEYDELLQLNLWDLFGISKKQLDMIDFSKIAPEDFIYFYTKFTEENRDIPIEKKILYSIADTVLDYNRICFSTSKSSEQCNRKVEYCEHIVDSHSLSEAVELMQWLGDYWRLLDDALEMNSIREAEGGETFNYIETPKPSHIKDLHDKAFRDYSELTTRRMIEQKDELNLMIRTTSESPAYKRFLFGDSRYIIKPVTSQEDLTEEGKHLNHCVASYGGYMANGKSFIYFIRKQSDPDTPYFTAEILPSDSQHPRERFKLTQLYGFNDSTDKPDDLRQFIRDWAINKKFTIKCII